MPQQKREEIKSLESFCKNETNFRMKLALISFYNIQYSDFIEKFLLAIEYLQLISQGLLLFPFLFHGEDFSPNLFAQIVIYMSKIISPGYFEDRIYQEELTLQIFALITALTMLKFIFTGYIFATVSSWKYHQNSWILKIWRLIFKLQGRFLYFFMTSFWVNLVINKHTVFGMSSAATICFACIMIFSEFAFSLFLDNQFVFILPTSDYLASKNSNLRVTTLTQKIIIQILQMLTRDPSKASAWIICILNLVLSSGQSVYFYKTLPLYNFKALLFQGSFLSIVLSLHFVSLMHTLLWNVDYYEPNINFLVVTWILVSILVIRTSREGLKTYVTSLLLNENNSSSPELFIHKICFSDQLDEDEEVPLQHTDKASLKYLLSQTRKNNDVLKSEDQDPKNVYLKYIKKILREHPKNDFLRLYHLQLLIQTKKPFIKILNAATKINQKKNLTLELLISEAETNLYLKKSHLDLTSYLRNTLRIEDIKRNILELCDLKSSICQNILDDFTDLGKIYDNAQSMNRTKAQVEKKIKYSLKTLPEYFISPFLLFAEYYLNFEYSLEHYKTFALISSQRFLRYRKTFKDPNLRQENIHHENTAFVLFSGQKLSSAQIIFCTKSIKDIFGRDKSSYTGAMASSLFPQCLLDHYEDHFQKQIFIDDADPQNKPKTGYLYHNEGYIFEAQIFIKIHPYMTTNQCFQMIIHAVNKAKFDYLLIKEDGGIENGTRNICKSAGITTLRPNIKQFSEELFTANKAFNIAIQQKRKSTLETEHPTSLNLLSHRESKKTSMTSEEAFSLYSTYTSEGKVVEIQNQQKEGISSSYHCKISIICQQPAAIKLFKLKKIQDKKTQVQRIKPSNSEVILSDIMMPVPTEIYHYETQQGTLLTERAEDTNRILLSTHQNVYSLPTENRLVLQQIQTKQLARQLTKHQNHESLKGTSTSYAISESVYEQRDQFRKKFKYKSNDNSSFRLAEKSSSKNFRKSLRSNSVLKSFYLLCFIFYTIVLATLFGQIVLKIVSDDIISDLVFKKNLLKYSEVRTYAALLIQTNAIGVVRQIQGGFAAGGTILDPASALKNIKSPHLKNLVDSNELILLNIHSLSTDLSQRVMQSDVQISGTHANASDTSSLEVTTFTVVSEISAAINRLQNLTNLATPEGLNLFQFMTGNILDDFLKKSLETIEIFDNSVQKQKLILERTILLCLILSPFSLFLVGSVIILIVWYQYIILKKSMEAVIKLPARGIIDMLQNLERIKKNINDDSQNLLEMDEIVSKLIEEQYRNYDKSQQRKQTIVYWTLCKNHFRYTLSIVFYILMLTGIMLGNYISAFKSTEVIYHRQNQLQFANSISINSAIAFSAVSNLFLTNRTLTMEGQDVYKISYEMQSTINSFSSQLNKFQELDGSYDPEIRAIIYENKGCYTLTEAELYFCQFLRGMGQPTNLAVAAAGFQVIYASKLADWEAADKNSALSILQKTYKDINNFVASFDVVAAEAKLIAEIVDKNLMKSVSDANRQRMVFLIIFALSMSCVSVLIWFHILARLKEVHNDFKKVLQVFPPNMVLSSFLLKLFLKDTSSEPLFL